MSQHLVVECRRCGFANQFSQPYPYHAGFGDTVFLYNEAGNCTLAWGTYDPAYVNLSGDPWHPPRSLQARLEALLPPSPKGDRWGFEHPARCVSCQSAIREPMIRGEVYYLEYSDSVVLGRAGLPSSLADVFQSAG